MFFNEDSNISPIIFYSQGHAEHTFREKGTVNLNNFTFHETNIFFFKYLTLHVSKINLFLDLKQNKIIKQKLKTT